MYTKTMRGLLLALTILAVSGVSMAWGQGPSVAVAKKDGLGAYLVDGKGMTLYYFAKDTPGASVCTGECLDKWPPLRAGGLTLGAGLAAKDFGELTTNSGPIVTFRGYPVYHFFKDAKTGDTLGQGVGGVWFVIDPAAFPPKK